MRFYCAAGVLCLLLGPIASVGAEEWLLAGNSQGLWLLHQRDPGEAFEAAFRPVGQRWTLLGSWQGHPGRAAAVEGRLHLVLRDPFGYLLLSAGPNPSSPGNYPDLFLKHWDKGAEPTALAAASSLKEANYPTLVAVVPQIEPAAPESQSAPGPAPAHGRPATRPAASVKPVPAYSLAFFQNTGREWRLLTVLPQAPLIGPEGVQVAVVDGALYAMLREPSRNSLRAWNGSSWSEVKLPAAVAEGRLLGMVSLRLSSRGGEQLVVVSAQPAERGDWRALVGVRDAEADRFTVQTVTGAGGEPAVWPQARLPLVAGMDDQLAFLRTTETAPELSFCNPLTGILLASEEVKVFEAAVEPGGGIRILQYYSQTVILAALLGWIVLRVGALPRPFVLPPYLAAANLGKRLLAAVIDQTPCWLVALLVFPPPDWLARSAGLGEAFREFTTRLPDLMARMSDSAEVAKATVLGFSLYTAYGILMEIRFGATLGKMLFHLRVAGEDGGRPGPRAVILRNLWRLAELSMPPLLLTVVLSRYRRRLGDVLSHTAVVESSRTPPPPPRETAEGP